MPGWRRRGDLLGSTSPGRRPIFLLGRDTRGSGPWIAKAFAEGAASQGVDILDAGVISTPSLAFLVPKRKALGGAMISASHNPAEFNGIKLFNPQGRGQMPRCPWEQLIEKRIWPETLLLPAVKARLRKDPTAVKGASFLLFCAARFRRALLLRALSSSWTAPMGPCPKSLLGF